MKIIDAHIHYKPEYEPFNLVAENSGHKNTAEHLKAEFEKNNICHAIVMGNITADVKDHNYPDNMSYCIGFDSKCFVDLEKNYDYFVYMAEENLKRDNCVGIKLYPGYCHYYVYDEIYTPFYNLAQKYQKPVAIHTGAVSNPSALLKYSHPLTLDEAAVKFPNVRFVMCHFGNPFLADAAAVCEKNRNITIDISGLIEGNFDVDWYFKAKSGYVEILKAWLNYFGDYKRIMYGSDWPIVNIEKYIDVIKRIIPEENHEDVFFNNAVNFYGLNL